MGVGAGGGVESAPSRLARNGGGGRGSIGRGWWRIRG